MCFWCYVMFSHYSEWLFNHWASICLHVCFLECPSTAQAANAASTCDPYRPLSRRWRGPAVYAWEILSDLRFRPVASRDTGRGKIIKWPTNPHKCSQFQFGEIMIQIFTSQQKKTNNCWMLGTFANLFFGGDGNPYWTGRHLYEVVFFFHGELSKVRKRQQSWFCGYHVWKPSEMGPGFFIFAGFGVGRHATVLRTQHCLPGVLLWEPDIRKKVFQQAHRDIHKSRSCETWRTNLQMSQHLPTSFSKLGFERQHVWRELFFFGPLWND